MTFSLSRATLGRLAAFARTADLVTDVNEAFDAADWTGFSTTGTSTPTVTADATPGELSVAVNVGSGHRGARLTTVDEVDQFVIAICRTQTTGGAPGAYARIKSATPTADSVVCNTPKGFNGFYTLAEIIAGVTDQSQTTAANRSTSSESIHALEARGTIGRSYQGAALGSSGPATISQTLTDPLDAGTDGTQGGVGASSSAANTFRYRQYSVMRSALFTVNGPDAGAWVVRIRNAAGTLIYTSAAHVGGVVSIDTLAEIVTLYSNATPLMAQVEVYDPGSAQVLAGPEIPDERLWGGDVWTFEADPIELSLALAVTFSPVGAGPDLPLFPLEFAGVRMTFDRMPVYDTAVLEAGAGNEYRLQKRALARHRYRISIEILRQEVAEELATVLGLFQRKVGALRPFWILDPADGTIPAEYPMRFGTGDGAETDFQLQRSLVPAEDWSSPMVAFWPDQSDGFVPIFYPYAAPLIVYVDGVALVPNVDWTLGPNGLVTFAAAPDAGAVLTWSGAFYRKVRFLTDRLDFRRIVTQWWEVPTLECIEVR